MVQCYWKVEQDLYNIEKELINMELQELRKIYIHADEIMRNAEGITNHEVYSQFYNRGHQLQEIVQDQLRLENYSEKYIWELTEQWLLEK